MNFFQKHIVAIFRFAGVVFLLSACIVYFLNSAPKSLTPQERAIMNVARMEGQVKTQMRVEVNRPHSGTHLSKGMKDSHEKQLKYFTILAMLFGVGLIGYSFIPKKEE